jgi:hypothetical protein
VKEIRSGSLVAVRRSRELQLRTAATQNRKQRYGRSRKTATVAKLPAVGVRAWNDNDEFWS